MEFLKSSELALNPAGYLISTVSNKPVWHSEFISQQNQADYIVRLSVAIKDKNFTVNKVDDLDAIKKEIREAMWANQTVKYVNEPVKPVSAVNEELIQFALDFNNYTDQKAVTEKINKFMNQFNSINDVETVGEYFTDGLSKLSKIYTIAEILEAVKINVAKLGNL